MLRIERDAAEDEYYSLKQKHDEALWKIEDLESQLKSIQEQGQTTGASYEELEAIDEFDQAYLNSYPLDAESDPVDDPPANPKPSSLMNATTGISPVGSDLSPEAVTNVRPQTAGDGESEVSYVDIDTQLTRGFDSHGKTGDDGIVVAIKPMNEAGEFVPIAAPVTISLIDPARNGIRQRVGLWKFSSEQVASRIDFKNQVFLFRLPWQRQAPMHSDLKLFIRFQADDGKRETEMDFHVVLDDAPRSRWTEMKDGKEPDNTLPIDLSPPSSWTITEKSEQGDESTVPSDPTTRIARPEWSPIR